MNVENELKRASIACLFIAVYAMLSMLMGVAALAVLFLSLSVAFLVARDVIEDGRPPTISR